MVLFSVVGTIADPPRVAARDPVTLPYVSNRYPVYVPGARVNGRQGRYDAATTAGGAGPTAEGDADIQ